MSVQSYVLVSNDPANLTILGGPLAWDGVASYTPPSGTHTMLSADATAAGYTFPPPPAAQVNAQVLQGKALNALVDNITYIGTAAPSAAVTTAQVKSLSRQVNALIKLMFAQTDDTSGT